MDNMLNVGDYSIFSMKKRPPTYRECLIKIYVVSNLLHHHKRARGLFVSMIILFS